MLGARSVEPIPDLAPAGISISASAWRLAAIKSRLSIIAAVRDRRLTIEPERGRHADPV
jgi:hypothetical protein